MLAYHTSTDIGKSTGTRLAADHGVGVSAIFGFHRLGVGIILWNLQPHVNF